MVRLRLFQCFCWTKIIPFSSHKIVEMGKGSKIFTQLIKRMEQLWNEVMYHRNNENFVPPKL